MAHKELKFGEEARSRIEAMCAEIKVGSDDVLILRESDVLAKVLSTGSKGKSKKKLAGAAA